MKRRLAKNHSVILAMNRSEIIGVIEVRNYNHISLFFMKKQYQNKGIGKKINELAVNNCRQNRPDVTGIEVHSSPYAVPIYEKLGFVKLGAERIENGMRFAPMMLNL